MTTTIVKSAGTEKDLDELKKLEHRELEQLQKQDRLNDHDQLKPGDAITERQGKVVRALTLEKRNLVNNLKLIKSTRTQKLDNEQADKINQLFQEMDSLDEQLSTEKKYLSDLKKQILMSTNAIYQARRRAGYEDCNKVERSEKNVCNLRNKLYSANVKLNETLKENRQLKENIELQLVTRNAYNAKYSDLLKKLEAGKRIVSEAMEEATDTYSKREITIKKLTGLRDRNRADLKKRSDEMQDLQMRLEQEVRTRDFRQVSSQKRIMHESERRMKMRVEEERQQNIRLEQQYTNIYKDITEFKETEDIELVKSNFMKCETENMMLFNYANETNCELEVLSAQIQEKMDSYLEEKSISEERILFQTQKISEMESYLDLMKTYGNQLSRDLVSTNKLVKILFAGIETLFAKSECDQWPIEQLLGDNEHVSVFNYPLYLKLVEERIIQLLTIYDFPKLEDNFFDFMQRQSTEREDLKTGQESKYEVSEKLFASEQCLMCLTSIAPKDFNRGVQFDLNNTGFY